MTTAVATMSPTRGTVGRKRRPPSGKAKTLRQRFARRLHELAGDDISNKDIAEACGVSPGAVTQWFAAKQLPDMEYWPALGRIFGLSDYREILPPPR